MQGVYIPHFDQITVKISVLGVLYHYCCIDGVKFGMEVGPSVHSSMQYFTPIGNFLAKFHPDRCNVSLLRGEEPQNRPLSELKSSSSSRNAAGN